VLRRLPTMMGSAQEGVVVTASSTVGAPQADSARRRPGPPGPLFTAATAVAILIALDANSRASFGMFVITAPIWLGLAIAWGLRFLVALARTRLRLSPGEWARWLAIPLAMGLVFVATRTDAVRDARFALSRPALDAMAAEVIAGGTTQRGWVGLYHVGEAERTANGVLFVLDEFFGRRGFAYAPTGLPNLYGYGDLDPAGGPMFEPVGDGWWYFVESWGD